MSSQLLSPARAPRGRVRPDLVYLGWQHAAPAAEPGPMPEQPGEVELDEIDPEWLSAQRREQDRLGRPARLAGPTAGAVAVAAAICWRYGVMPAGIAAALVLAAVVVAARCAGKIIEGERSLRGQVRAERHRVDRIRALQLERIADRREQRANAYRNWQQRRAAYWRQPQWYPVTMPVQCGRVDLAGGTPSGWSALLTMIASTRLAAGGEVTVLDLTESAVARDLIALAASIGVDPLVWVLPGDLPALGLRSDLGSERLAEILALTVAGAEPDRAADPAKDAALLGRVLAVLEPEATMVRLLAALRALAQIGDPRRQLADGPLAPEQLTQLSAMFGRSSAHLVVERAWQLEARLRMLASLGSAAAGRPRSRLRVAWPDRRTSTIGSSVLGSYLTAALSVSLRQEPAGDPWQQSIFVLGAERLAAEMIDRLCDAAEAASAGLLLGYRSIPAAVRDRLGRGSATVAFMRLGNAQDARAAAEQIGTEHRFVVSQLTDTVGTSVTHSTGNSYTSTVGTAESVADSSTASWTAGRSRGHGQSRSGGLAPFADGSGSASRDASLSAAVSDSRTVSQGISASTSWGVSTSAALAVTGSLAGTVQRSRELLIEPHELQHLPQTAVVVCQSGPDGRHVQLADANPAIMTLPTATLARRPAPADAEPSR